jgi:hypothetical protein
MRGTRKNSSRRVTGSVVAVASVAGIGLLGVTPAAHAATWKPVESRTVTVPESSSGVPVYMTFASGEEARIECSGSVWGGVWFTGSNGPDGWADAAPFEFPMPYYRGGRSFAAIARFKTTGFYPTASSWKHAGTSSAHTAPFSSRMELRVNDNAPGNGSGSFTCTVSRWQLVP